MGAYSSTYANSSTIQHEWTSTCVGTEIRNGRCITCREPASGSWQLSGGVRVSGNQGDVVRISVTAPVPVDIEEILSEVDPWHQAYAKYTPTVKAVVPVWKQRQMLRQQRPRDGLR